MLTNNHSLQFNILPDVLNQAIKKMTKYPFTMIFFQVLTSTKLRRTQKNVSGKIFVIKKMVRKDLGQKTLLI